MVNEYYTVLASKETKWCKKFRFLSADNSVYEVINDATIMRDEKGKAYRVIGSMQNLTREEHPEQTFKQKNKERLKEVLNSSSDVLWDLDLVANELIINDAYKTLFGHTMSQNFNIEEWLANVHPDYKEAAKQHFYSFIESSETKLAFSYKFLRADGSVADIITRATMIRNGEGKVLRIMGTTHDVTKQKELEKKVEYERQVKEKQVAEAIIDAQEHERVELSKELHDNVNQLLGAAKLYNEMAQKNGVNRENLLKKSSAYTLSAIEEIRKISKGLVSFAIADAGLLDAVKNLAKEIMEAHAISIICTTNNFLEEQMNNRFKLNVYRIVQEQLNNVIKHSKATEVIIDLSNFFLFLLPA